MPKDVGHLFGRLGRGLGQVSPDAFRPRPDVKVAWQVVERMLPDQVDQVLGGVEVRRVDRGVQEFHGDPLRHGGLRQQFGQSGLHGLAVDAAVVEHQNDPAEAERGIAQDDHGEGQHDIFGLGLRLEVGGRLAADQVDGQEAVEPLPPLLVARDLRRGVLSRPGVMAMGRGQQGKFVEGHDGGVRPGPAQVFFSADW